MFRIVIASLALGLGGCVSTSSSLPSDDVVPSVFDGAVSAADPRAQAAGEEMLRKGGSATDAAIAVMLALTVVEPQSSGIGGGGFMVRGQADGEVTTFDGRETAPSGATPDWFLTDEGEVPPFIESVRSGLSVGVPGNIALAAKAHAVHGKLDWADLFAPAIRLARDGFLINPRLHGMLGSSKDRAAWTEVGRALFYDVNDQPLPIGTKIRNERLARTFEALASAGPVAFYEGALAEQIVSTVSAETPRQAAMKLSDIETYEAKERDAVCGVYRAHRVCTMGPPTSGGVAVLQILGQLERFDLSALGVDNPVTWHLFIESQRLAYADRELYLADNDFVSVPVEGLTDPAYLARRSALIDMESTLATAEPGTPTGASPVLADGDEPEEHGTSHFAVVDADNTLISYTSTIEGAFGSGLMAGGFFLNNELTDFSRVPQIGGRLVANRVEGGKRPRSSMAPVIVYDEADEPLLAVGAAGGSTIPVQTARSIIAMIDFGLQGEDILGLPFIMAFGDSTLLEENTWLENRVADFRKLGHENLIIREAPVKGGAVQRTADGWIAARDPRLKGLLELP